MKNVALLLLAILLCSPACESGTSEESAKPQRAEPALLVIMSPGGPTLARLDISVDRQPYREWVTKLLADRLDLNRDGQLNEQELGLIPDRLLSQAKLSDSKALLRSMLQDRKEQVDPDASMQVKSSEFQAWFANRLADDFNIVATPVKASEAVRLSALIDSNSDGMVTETEVRGASDILKFRDLDDDQTFTAAELLPFRDPRTQSAALVPEVANLPMIQVTNQPSADRAATQIIARFGSEGSLPVSALRLPKASMPETSDSDQIAQSRLAQWLLEQLHSKTPSTLHLDVAILLSDRASASRLSIELASTTADFCRVEMFRKDSRCQLKIDGMQIEIRTRGGSKSSRGFMVSFLLQRMSSYDQDKDGALSADEFPALQSELSNQLRVSGSFEELDMNLDGLVRRDEVQGFIERDSLATQSRIEVSVRQSGRTLFKLIDQNEDRRLSPRELLNGFAPLKEFDFDDDQRVSESELGTSYLLTIGLGQAESLRRNPMMMQGAGGASTDAVLPGVAGLTGPEWFRRMDRNQDGDVSWREFLGEKTIFSQLDRDSNQLIDAMEAESLN